MSLFQDNQSSTNRAKLIARKQLEAFNYLSALIKEQARIITPDITTAMGTDAAIVASITTAMVAFVNTVAPLIGKESITATTVTLAPAVVHTILPSVTVTASPATTTATTAVSAPVTTTGTATALVNHPAAPLMHHFAPDTHTPIIHPPATTTTTTTVTTTPLPVAPHPAMPKSSVPVPTGVSQ